MFSVIICIIRKGIIYAHNTDSHVTNDEPYCMSFYKYKIIHNTLRSDVVDICVQNDNEH